MEPARGAGTCFSFPSSFTLAVFLFLLLSPVRFLPGDILFSDIEWELGDIPQGQERNIKINIKNTGETPVNFSFQSTCACLSVAPESLVIQPGSTESFTLSFLEKEESGPFTKHLVIRSDYPGLNKAFFQVRGVLTLPGRQGQTGPEGSSQAPADSSPAAAGSVPPGEPESSLKIVRGEYYYDPACRECAFFLAETIPRMERKLDISIELALFDILVPKNFERLDNLLAALGLPGGAKAFPVLIIGGDVLAGDRDIDTLAEELFRKKALSKEDPELTSPGTAGDTGDAGAMPPEDAPAEGGQKAAERLVLAPVFLAGLLDGVNPCAFTTLIFLIAAMTLAGKKQREVLIIGSFFTLSVFVSYYLIGLGFFAVLRRAALYPMVSLVLRYILAAVLLTFAVLSAVDYFRIRRGRPGDMLLQLPKRMKRAIHSSIRGSLRSPALAGSSIILGFLVSIFELGCTGQIYFPTIAYVIRSGGGLKGYLALGVYNIGFIIPLAGVFVLAYRGMGSKKIGDIFAKHLGAVKLATAGLFILLAGLTLFLP